MNSVCGPVWVWGSRVRKTNGQVTRTHSSSKIWQSDHRLRFWTLWTVCGTIYQRHPLMWKMYKHNYLKQNKNQKTVFFVHPPLNRVLLRSRTAKFKWREGTGAQLTAFNCANKRFRTTVSSPESVLTLLCLHWSQTASDEDTVVSKHLQNLKLWHFSVCPSSISSFDNHFKYV